MKDSLQELDALIAKRIEEKKLPGVSVCLRGRDGIIFQKGYGYGDPEHRLAVDENTIYGIASMSKSTVTLALCILQTEGKFSFEDPVVKYFPEFRVPGNPVDDVCVKHLAMHTAGIPPMETLEWSIVCNTDYPEVPEYARVMRETAPNSMSTIGEIIDYIAHCPYKTLGAPGEIMSYSNEDYAILSYIVDIAAGVPLEQFLNERVFGPIGMTRTVLDEDYTEAYRIASDGNISMLFSRDEEGVFRADRTFSHCPPFRGCACVKSTANDMARYYQCLSDGGMIDGKQVIPAEAVEIMLGAAFPAQEKPFYAFGLNKRAKAGHVFCEHAGGLHGVSTFGGAIMGEGIGACALCNEGGQDTDDITWMLYNYAIGLPLEESHVWLHPSGHDFSEPEMLTGTFACHEEAEEKVRVYVKDGKLLAENGNGVLEPVHCGGTWFRGKRNGEYVCRMQFHVRDGKAWALRMGTRVWERVGD